VARRPRIELVEDAAGVRLDVITAKRIDLALGEVQERLAHRNPALEAGWLGAAEAFVRGAESSRERTHPDSLFQLTVSGHRRDAWDMVDLRVSVPGDVSGALTGHRFIDLAPQSEESRLFAALAEQETVRLRWVTEGVELLYRLPPEHRDSWRQALATNETRTDEERHARYEELLAWGMATMSELPFYRHVAPRRPRRTAQTPANPIPFFAKRSGSVPSARRPTIAGIRLPTGRRAPDSLPSYWISDEPLEACGSLATPIARAFAETGLWPLLWPWDEDPAAYLDQPIEPDRIDAIDVETVLRRGWDRIAAHPAGLVEPVGPRFPGLAVGSPAHAGASRDPFRVAGIEDVSARLMVVSCNRPADCVALIGGTRSRSMQPRSQRSFARGRSVSAPSSSLQSRAWQSSPSLRHQRHLSKRLPSQPSALLSALPKRSSRESWSSSVRSLSDELRFPGLDASRRRCRPPSGPSPGTTETGPSPLAANKALPPLGDVWETAARFSPRPPSG
jgi:hypothetical protein